MCSSKSKLSENPVKNVDEKSDLCYIILKGSEAMEAYMPFVWIGLAVVMILAEVGTVQLVSVWFAAGAICAAVSCIFTSSIPVQGVVFVVVSVASLAITKPLVKKIKKQISVSTNADRYIGQTGELLTDLDTPQSVGRMRVMGSDWSVRSDDAPLKKGDRVTVLSIEGVKLIVKAE